MGCTVASFGLAFKTWVQVAKICLYMWMISMSLQNIFQIYDNLEKTEKTFIFSQTISLCISILWVYSRTLMQKSWKALAGLPSRQSTGPFLGMQHQFISVGLFVPLESLDPRLSHALRSMELKHWLSVPGHLWKSVFSRWNATFLARSYYGNVEFNRISI